MEDIIGYLFVVFILIGITYGFVKQLQYSLTIQRTDTKGILNYNRLLYGNYLASFSMFGFIISYILNVLIALQIIKYDIVTSDITALSCFIFLLVLLIAKLLIIPKSPKHKKLLSS